MLGALIVTVQAANAKVGVGVASGSISLSEPLYPGNEVLIPPVTVINTGDETAQYSVSITYHQDQPAYPPPAAWFHITPDNFSLEPGESKAVEVKIQIPIKVEIGEYFAYIEARPENTVQTEQTKLGIAAATKLDFTVENATRIQAIMYWLRAFWLRHAIPIVIVSALIVTLSSAAIIKMFLKIDVSIKRDDE